MKSKTEVFVYGSKSDAMWRSSGAIRAVNGGGYDLLVQSDIRGFLYEDRCFDAIAHRLSPNEIAIGPHLTDLIFSRNTPHDWANEVRPDAMMFYKAEGHWVLMLLAEIKSNHVNGMHRKLEGFSGLLTHMRKESWFLPKRLREYAGDMIQIPKMIQIPADSSVNVLFMAPFEKGADGHTDGTTFPVTYMRI